MIMAGKTKKQGGRPTTPRTPKTPDTPNTSQLGHLGLKSSPYAPTDCKLVSQYMVRDRMAAHYKKLNKAKAAVDCGPPKAYLVSQKMRDQARREAMKADGRNQPYRPKSARRHSLHESDLDKLEMQGLMESLSNYGDDNLYDNFNNTQFGGPRTSTSMEPHPSESNSEMQLVNRMIDDNEMSPSRYAINKTYKSNIPAATINTRSKSPYASATTHVVAQKPLYKTQLLQTYSSPQQPKYNQTFNNDDSLYYDTPQPLRTPRGGDVIDMHNDKFTEAKPFQPRTLKSNRQSKLSQFKYYTPPPRPKKSGDVDVEGQTVRPESSMSGKAMHKPTGRSRPGTANTEMNSTDWMNETIMSRDFSQRSSPAGVPRLDITLDGDNINWLSEQKGKAKLRKSINQQDESMNDSMALNATYDRPATRGSTGMNGTLNTTYGNSMRLNTARKMAEEEEELAYLEFIQDVTSDVLDRGIFTNRMLKQVFETHIIKRRHKLNETKMREKLEDLRIELGIPESDEGDYDGVGLTSTTTPTSSSRAQRRARQEVSGAGGGVGGGGGGGVGGGPSGQPLMSSTISKSKQLPNLHSTKPTPVSTKAQGGRTRSKSPDSKPPLPRSGGGGLTKSQQDSSSSSLGKTQEVLDNTRSNGGNNGGEEDDDSVFGTVTQTHTGTAADILKVEHTELGDTLNTTQGMDDTIRPEEQTLAYQQQLQASLDRSDDELTESSLHNDSHRSDTHRSNSHRDRYTERTESHSPDFTPQNTDRDQHTDRNTKNGNQSDDYDADDFEQVSPTITPRRQRTPSDSKMSKTASPRRRRREAAGATGGAAGGAIDSARSYDHTNTTSETIGVSELSESVADGSDDDDGF